MTDIDLLIKQVTLEEYEEASRLFFHLREREISAAKAAGMVFRAGRLAGRRQGRAEISRLQRMISELKNSPPEATKEGSNNND